MTKNQLNEELQPAYRMGRILAFFKYGKRRISFFNNMIDRNFVGKDRAQVITERFKIMSKEDGREIPIVAYKPLDHNGPMPIMLYMHGGGYVSGSPEMAPGLENYILKRPVIIIAPKYRRSLEAPYPAGFDDCYETLLWIKEHGHEIGGNGKIIIAGNSAGGGLAAAVTLKNRDKQDVDIAFQMPLYPMLDHRNDSASANRCQKTPIWDHRTNQKCWDLYLRDVKGEVPIYASPALNKDFKNLPPAISFVGGADPFEDEVKNYMDQLIQSGVEAKFEFFPEAFHGFEEVVPDAEISQKAKKFTLDAYADYYDRYYIGS